MFKSIYNIAALITTLTLVSCDGIVLDGAIDSKLNSSFLITSMTPNTAKPSEKVSIFGMNFTDDLEVKVDGVAVSDVSISPELITFTLPEGRQGLRNVTVSSENSSSSASMIRLSSDGLPVLTSSDASSVCSSESFYNMEGDKLSGTKDCKQAVPNCTSENQADCLANDDFPAISVSSIQNKIDCKEDGQTECMTKEDMPAADGTFNPGILAEGKTLAGIAGTSGAIVYDCESEGQVNCIIKVPLVSVNTAGLADKIKVGTSIAAISGTFSVVFPDAKYVLKGDSSAGIPGKLSLPDANKVLDKESYGVETSLSLGKLTLPSPAHVISTAPDFGDPLAPMKPSFQPDFPPRENVLAIDQVDGQPGLLSLPNPANVLLGQSFGVNGNGSSGSLKLPIAANVHKSAIPFGVVGEEEIPSFDPQYPSPDQVLHPETTDGKPGTLHLPDPKHVLLNISYGRLSSILIGSLTLPLQENVLFGSPPYGVNGNESIPSYKPDFPSRDNVLKIDQVDGLQGRLELPIEGAVLSGTAYGAGGDSKLGTYILPDPTKVHSDADKFGVPGELLTPSYTPQFPDKKFVLAGKTVNNEMGTLTLPDEKHVYSGIAFGNNDTLQGTLISPDPSMVKSTAPLFGIEGTQAGTYTPDFPNVTNVRSIDFVDGHRGTLEDCTTNKQVNCVTTSTYRATDFTNLKPENIRKNVTVAGVEGKYPSAAFPLTGATATEDLVSFDQNTANGSYEFFDSTGKRFEGSVAKATLIPETAGQTIGENGTIYSNITLQGDPNFLATNIKAGVQIFSVPGNFTTFSYGNCYVDGMLGCLTTAAFPAANLEENVKPEKIKAGVNIAGVMGTLETGPSFIKILQPSGWDDLPVNNAFTVTYSAYDQNANYTVDLFYSYSNTGCDASMLGWTKINLSNLYANSKSLTVSTLGVPQGYYYVCGRFNLPTPLYSVSESPVAIAIENNCLNPNGHTWQNNRGGCSLVSGAFPLTYGKQSAAIYTYSEAISYCNNLTESGIAGGWRLPSRDELLFASYANSAAQFSDPGSPLWSSTSYSSSDAYVVRSTPNAGFLYYDFPSKSIKHKVRCVR